MMNESRAERAAGRLPRIGVQLYTVRDRTDPPHFKETLADLARMGYAGVEFAWQYGGMEPAELADFLSAQGLVCCGLHVNPDELLQPDHTVYAFADALHSGYMTTSLAGREAEWDAWLPRLTQMGQIVADHGMRFTYHNHWQEFNAIPGKSAFDRLVRETPSAQVELELDLGWVHRAGWDALGLWRELAARTPQIHLRDYDREAETNCDLGDGFLDAAAIGRQSRECQTDWLIFEQSRYPVDAMTSCRTAIQWLRRALGVSA